MTDLPPTENDHSDEAPPTIYRYRVAVVLTPALEMRINAARQTAGLPAAALGSFALHSDFHCPASEAVVDAVRNWAGTHLPLKMVIERVDAAVIGENRYVAGMALEPAERLKQAQRELEAALAPVIEPLPETDFLFAARLPVSDHTPAASFPPLIHALQQEFESREWTINAVEVLRAPEGDPRWEVVEKLSA